TLFKRRTVRSGNGAHPWRRVRTGLHRPADRRLRRRRQASDSKQDHRACENRRACQLHTHARCRSERAVSYESHVSESSGSPEQHDLVRLGASSLHTGCANRHSRYGEPGCARLVVEEPPERDGGNVITPVVPPSDLLAPDNTPPTAAAGRELRLPPRFVWPRSPRK